MSVVVGGFNGGGGNEGGGDAWKCSFTKDEVERLLTKDSFLR